MAQTFPPRRATGAAVHPRGGGPRQQRVAAFDVVHGGFGAGPKFPHPVELQFLLRRGRDEGDAHALHIALSSLRRRVEGGLYDQIAGGFFCSSVDAAWRIPRFEQRLCDNALPIGRVAEAYGISAEPLFRCGWRCRPTNGMSAPRTGGCSTAPTSPAAPGTCTSPARPRHGLPRWAVSATVHAGSVPPNLRCAPSPRRSGRPRPATCGCCRPRWRRNSQAVTGVSSSAFRFSVMLFFVAST